MIKTWQEFEEHVADLFDGKRQKGSGNGDIAKGDVITKDFLFECKWTAKDYYRLHKKTWIKLCEEAMIKNRIPVFTCCGKKGIYYCISSMDYDHDLKSIKTNDINNKDSYIIKLMDTNSPEQIVFDNNISFIIMSEVLFDNFINKYM